MEDQFNDELRQAAMRIKRRNMIGIGTAVILSAATLPLLLDEDKEEQKFEFGQAGGEAPKNPNKSQTDNDSASGTYLESRYQRHDTDLQAGAIRHQFASTVRVIDANTGRLIEGAQVLLAATAEAASHAEGATAYTDQQGSTVLRTVDNPRTQWLLVTHPKYQCVLRPPQDAEASHEPGPNESIAFDVRLTAALQLTVNVMDTTDRPLAGVEVYAGESNGGMSGLRVDQLSGVWDVGH